MNRLARYVGRGCVEIVEEPDPPRPEGGLIVRTEACGLCSGELMAWYMDRKLPHVLGHEVAGVVEESDDPRFPVGTRVFPHHHAPCGRCDRCRRGLYVHCLGWKATRLTPGGMAERFAVAPENLTDTHAVDDLRAEDAALTEPLACVAKAVRFAAPRAGDRVAVIGLGFMGLLHALLHPGCVGYDLNGARREWAAAQGVDARPPEEAEEADVAFVLPGSQGTLDLALRIAAPEARVVLFAPPPPDEAFRVPQEAYFKDVSLHHAYSCGPDDTADALAWLRAGLVRAEQAVSHFIPLDELPVRYVEMRDGAILKPMVMFP